MTLIVFGKPSQYVVHLVVPDGGPLCGVSLRPAMVPLGMYPDVWPSLGGYHGLCVPCNRALKGMAP